VPNFGSVSVYVRRKDETYHATSPKAVYVLGTQFVLRYALNGRRRWERLPRGITYIQAKAIANERENALYRGETPDKPQAPAPPRPQPKPTELTLDRAIDQYLELVKVKAPKTQSEYGLTMKQFYACVGNRLLRDLRKEDLHKFVSLMREQGKADRTIHNRAQEVMTMLRHFEIREVWVKVKYTEKIVRAYRPDELLKLFAAATPEEWLVFQFFLCTGCREAEVMNAQWSDVDLTDKIYTVTEHLPNFRPKDSEEREIPIPDHLVDALKARAKTSHLIFPNQHGNPDGHFLKKLKALAKRAGLKGEFILHKFRKTYATLQHRAGVDVRTISRRLGHSDLETTLLYLEAEGARSEKSREQVNATFGAFAETTAAVQ
jgi:integrase/recombinase XerD